MKLFDRFKKIIAAIILTAFIPSQAWAQGISIPGGATLNLGNGQLTVPGGITNAGTLTTATGNIKLTGSWANSGTFNAGTSTVTFNGTSGTQDITSGGSAPADAFYNLTHNTASTVQLNSNAITIDNNFSNSVGPFNANSQNMTVDGNWDNTAAFTAGIETVTLGGANGTTQDVSGTTTFYGFAKTNSSDATILFDIAGTQTFTNSLTLQGGSLAHPLVINSSNLTTAANIALQAGGEQSISAVNVNNSNASGGITLIAYNSPDNHAAMYNNTNWDFLNGTIKWIGAVSTEWQNPFNWDEGTVPAAGDTVVIQPVGGAIHFEPDLCPSTRSFSCQAVSVGNLTIDTNASLTLSGQNLTLALMSGTPSFVNQGNLILQGTETLNFNQDTTLADNGTFTYIGDNTGHQITIKHFGATDYNNLVIDDTNTNKDTFVTGATSPLNTLGNVTVTSGTLDISANTDTLTVGGTLAVNGGILTATNGNIIASGAVNISAGTFTAPGAGKTFDIAGNFDHSNGTFTNSSGTVTLNGTNQAVFGTTVFYNFNKTIASAQAETLTFDSTNGTLQTFSNSLSMNGFNGSNLLTINSGTPNGSGGITITNGSPAAIALSPNGVQSLDFLTVQDSNAGTSPAQVTLVPNNSSGVSDNTNWIFGGITLTWTGNMSTNWSTAGNWDRGFIPRAVDTVNIPGGTTNEPNLCPGAGPCSTVTVTSLTIGSVPASAASASLTLNGTNLTVSPLGPHTFNNNGTLILDGNETLTLTMDSSNGTFEYVGQGGSSSANITLAINGSNALTYNNLTINDTNTHQDTFFNAGNMTVKGSLSVTSGALNASNAAYTWAVTGSVTIAANGVLDAPASTGASAFTVGGNWTNNGTFNNDNGLITLNGTATQSVLGSSTFYQFAKTITASSPETLTFDATNGTLQTFTNKVTFLGNGASNLLTINSSITNTQGHIVLSINGLQSIDFVNVQDSSAAGGVELVGRDASASSSTQNNTNWEFGTTTITWNGNVNSQWNNPSNWDLGLVPIAGDIAVIPGGTNVEPVLNVNANVGQLTIGSGSYSATASLTLSGFNLTVNQTPQGVGNGLLTNNGTIILNGSETVNITTVNTNAGTFEFVGDNTGSTYNIANNVTIAHPSADTYYNLTIDDTHGTPDTFTVGNAALNVDGNLTVTKGILNLSTSSAVSVAGNVVIGNLGVLTAPSGTTPTSFTVGGNWTNNGANDGTNNPNNNFIPNGGEVNFNTMSTAIITGNSTFYDLYSTTAGKVFKFTPNSIQTVTNTLSLSGLVGNLITLESTVTGSQWKISLSSPQNVGQLNVEDSDASSSSVTCLNCTDSGDNTNWIFGTLLITVPASGTTTVGQTPTVIGVATKNATIYIRDISGNLVATTMSDNFGNFRVVIGHDEAKKGLTITPELATGSNTLTPYLTAVPLNPGNIDDIQVAASTSTNQVPVIDGINCPSSTPNCTNVTPGTTQFITSGANPTISGQGLANAAVTVQARDANGNLIPAGTGVVNGSGFFSVPLTTALPSETNFLSVTVGSSANNTASALVKISLTDPFGYVYDSSTNNLIQGAVVTLYDSATNKVANDAGLKSCNAAGTCCDTSGTCVDSTGHISAGQPGNPFTTGADGFYSFLVPKGNYYIGITAAGYTYPSKEPSNALTASRSVLTGPSGTDMTGSEGEVFAVDGVVRELDQPMDGNATLLHIVKTANKSEGSVGDIVMYTVNVNNISANTVNNILINDEIPPGFAYIKDRVLLNNAGTTEPSGHRPLVFSIGSLTAGSADILQYQLVIGAGVTMGTYQNTATARYASGLVISNPSQASVKIVPDPVFDLGTVIGKVFFDWNENGIQDPPYFDPISHETIVEKPVPNVQIVMEDGTVITTDKDGQFSIPGLLPGRHLFRVDERTLPPGAYLTTEKAVIADITAGSIAKVNFGVNIDQSQTKSRDAVFFNEKIRLTEDRNRPVPRLNAAIFDASANAQPNTEEVVLYEGALVRQAEFRLFTNYTPFINSWRLDIMDAQTHKVIKSFNGTPLNINDPIYWNGQDDQDIIINPDHKYSYIFSVADDKNNRDDTKEKPITVREIKDDDTLKKETAETKDVLKDRADRYRKWLDAQAVINNLDHQLIQVRGETIHLDRQGTDVKSIHIMKGNQLFMDLPLTQRYGLTPDELMAGGFSTADEKDNLETILPNGDYSLDVVSVKSPETSSTPGVEEVPQSLPTFSTMPSRSVSTSSPGTLEHYSRPLKVGDDYVMFVALGDAQVGYNIDRGNIEPIEDKTEEPGLYAQGKLAYYLKGQILGKYLITSSFDSDRQEKALFRSLDPNVYYPVYGDSSSVNYDAADTQGPLYLKVEWDKSTAILGNYVIDFNDTDFAAFSQKYYGGMINYQSVANNPYGDARTKIVVYHAQVQQLPSHNEFLATGGSLYFLKYKNVIQGSDTVTIQVRDQTSGLVVASQTMVNGADYEMDNSNGTILFWQPVAMIAQSESIISNNLVNGDPIYVVVDYQYDASNLPLQGSQGARVAQAIGDNVVLGGTYIQDNSSGQNYTLEGTDATLHVDHDTTIKAEYAQTASQQQGSYVSTDGGITFAPLILNSSVSGEAYGIKGDTRLFDNIGLNTYYKWIGNNFGATDTSSQQGTEKMGMTMTFDMSPVTRLTASEDVQKLLAQNNIQSTTQVGASETDTTMLQVVHTAERLKLTGQFQMIETKSIVNGVESTTNQKGATMAGQAQYDLTDRIKVTLGQQVDVTNRDNTATTVGIADRVTDHTTLSAQDVFSSQGSAITGSITNHLSPKIAITNAFTLTSLNTGETDKTISVGVTDQVNPKVSLIGNVASTSSSTGTMTNTASVGAIAKISDNATVNMSLGKTQNATGAQGATNIALNGTTQIGDTTVTGTASANGGAGAGNPNALSSGSTNVMPGSNPLNIGTTGVTAASTVGVQAVTKVNEMTSTNGSVNVASDTSGGKTTTFGFGNNSKLDQELQAVTDNSFAFSPGGNVSDTSKYGLVNTNPTGQKLEGDLTQQTASQPGIVSESNIYGLSGDVNDKLALNASIQRGKIQNLGTGQSTITDFAIGSGYVLKDTESAEAVLKNSIKLELRLQHGSGTEVTGTDTTTGADTTSSVDSYRQYVLYDALEGKINDNTTANIKVDYSKTEDTTLNQASERHEEIILGMAYRPVNFDNLNLISEYSYQEGFGGGLAQADALNTNVNQTVTQVFTGEGVYDINDKWQADEKIAYRLEEEQDTGFAFTQTHTWLVIHRLNYKIDRNWTISGEYRNLVQVEAKDNKQGILLEATRDINSNTQLSIGWNFTNYTDDLTNLSYTTQGPFVRMTGKFYDETPEERARARAKWLDARISEWAWILIRKELSKKDSKIVLELNRMFILAKQARKAGRLEESRQIYKDIIAAGQMMFDEASEHIRSRINFEEQMQQLDKTARDYFKGGEYVKARKIWEKVVDEASKGVVK